MLTLTKWLERNTRGRQFLISVRITYLWGPLLSIQGGSLWWYKLMYILTLNFVCQRMPQSIVEMVRTDPTTALCAAFRSANTQLKRQSCWGHSNQCSVTKKCNERMMEWCLQDTAVLLGQTVTLLWQNNILLAHLLLAKPASKIGFSCKQTRFLLNTILRRL